LAAVAAHHDHLVLLGGIVSRWGGVTWFLAVISCKLVLVLQKAVLVARLVILAEIVASDGRHHLA